MAPLFQLRDLRIEFAGPAHRRIHAVNGATLHLSRGHVLGILGESGSGKSTVAKASLRLLPKNAHVIAGAIEFEGRDLLTLSERDMRELRGARISMIPQEPGLALNPVMKVGDQVAEVVRAHRDWNHKRCRAEATALLHRVHLDSADRDIYDAYPHQLSGGQQQRVAIAQAIACGPALIIADEPTASLDSDTEQEILQLLGTLKAEEELSLVLITHDPRILHGLANRVAVMYAGRIVEDGPLAQVFHEPQHPYTKALLACVLPPPGERDAEPGTPLPTIEGSAPDPELEALGCSFAPRCAHRTEVCDTRPPSPVDSKDRRVECFLYGG
jgi:oligopeptide/dipeptide ABC transporter ATP-binding protein